MNKNQYAIQRIMKYLQRYSHQCVWLINQEHEKIENNWKEIENCQDYKKKKKNENVKKQYEYSLIHSCNRKQIYKKKN